MGWIRTRIERINRSRIEKEKSRRYSVQRNPNPRTDKERADWGRVLPGYPPPSLATAAGFRSAADASTGRTASSCRESNAAGFACARARARPQGRSTAAHSRQDEHARRRGAPRRRRLILSRRAPPLSSHRRFKEKEKGRRGREKRPDRARGSHGHGADGRTEEAWWRAAAASRDREGEGKMP